MSPTFYKFLHITAILLTFITLGGLVALAEQAKSRKVYVALNGICLLVAFIAGFGWLAKANISWPLPIWVWVKMVGWLLVGMGPSFAKKLTPIQLLLMYGFIALVMVYMALYKPF